MEKKHVQWTAADMEGGTTMTEETKVEGTVPLYRYYNSEKGDHIYTTSWSELECGKNGYKYEKVQCFVFPQMHPGTVPFHRYYNIKAYTHYYNTDWKELEGSKNGYTYEGLQCCVYPQQMPGTIPLYYYHNSETGDNLYTTNWDELGDGKKGYTYKGVLCYVFPQPEPGTVPFYRYFNFRKVDHHYTTDWSELESGIREKFSRYTWWSYEKIQCYVHPTFEPGTVPLYRYFHYETWDHLFTIDWNELGHGEMEDQGYGFEQIQCYVYPVQVPGAVPLYRYFNSKDGDSFYTTNWSEMENGKNGYAFKRIECYVFPFEESDGSPRIVPPRSFFVDPKTGKSNVIIVVSGTTTSHVPDASKLANKIGTMATRKPSVKKDSDIDFAGWKTAQNYNLILIGTPVDCIIIKQLTDEGMSAVEWATSPGEWEYIEAPYGGRDILIIGGKDRLAIHEATELLIGQL